MASGSMAARLRMAPTYRGKDSWGRKREFNSKDEQQRHAKTKDLAEERVKQVLQDFQAEMSELTMNALADSAARLACSIFDMRVEYEKGLGALTDDDEQGFETLVRKLSKKRNMNINKWKQDPAWGQGAGLKQVKDECTLQLTSAIDDAREVPLNDEEAQKEEEELEDICKEWDDEEAANEKERSDKAALEEDGSNEAGPSGTSKGMKKMEEGSSLGGGNNESQWAAVWEEGESSKRPRREEGLGLPPGKKLGGPRIKTD